MAKTPEEINTLKAIQRLQQGYTIKDGVYASPGIVQIPTPITVKKAKGGSVKKKKKFPDLSGDGKITKKDILMAKGVIKKTKKGKK